MKYVLVIPDGCADEPQAILGDKTPLQAAHLPFMDEVVRRGVVGQSDNVPPALPSGSDVATMNLFGYDPLRYHTGRAPIEAAAQGIELGPHDWAIRCNFISVANEVLSSFTAGQIPNDVARRIIARLKQTLGSETLEFYAGVSYRNLLLYRAGATPAPFSAETKTHAPHDVPDRPIAPHLPQGPGADLLNDLMTRSRDILAQVPENAARGAHAATQIWLWGQGQRPALQPFAEKYGKSGAMITAVDLLRGLAALLGWQNIRVPTATGYLDTDYAAKGRAAIKALDDVDFVVVHVEATDEASHEGLADAKVDALEQIDRHIVGPVLERLEEFGNYRILVSPDHPTFLRTRMHSYGFVPFAACGTGIAPDSAETYDEHAAAASGLTFVHGHELMPWFLGDHAP